MPTSIKPKLYRTWCKCCIEFTIHKWIKIDSSNTLICDMCKTEDSGYSLKDIPEDKLTQQRIRYKNMLRKNFEKVLNFYNNELNILSELFSEPKEIGYTDIIEDDAGQKYIDDKQKEVRQLELHKQQEIINDYNLNYKKLNRNDKCYCGSGKKYKVCHLLIFSNLTYIKL